MSDRAETGLIQFTAKVDDRDLAGHFVLASQLKGLVGTDIAGVTIVANHSGKSILARFSQSPGTPTPVLLETHPPIKTRKHATGFMKAMRLWLFEKGYRPTGQVVFGNESITMAQEANVTL